MINTKHPMGAWADEMPPVNLYNYRMKNTIDPLNPDTWHQAVHKHLDTMKATLGRSITHDTAVKQSQSAFDIQVGGGHYKNYKIQPLEYVMANNLNFAQGNVVKYVTRYKEKNGIEDLKKARHYIDMLIELESKERASRT